MSVIELSNVFGQDAAGAARRPLGRLRGVSWSAGAGIHAVLGAPPDGTVALAALLTGQARPRSGRVVIGGRDPFRSPSLRRRIAALEPAPEWPLGRGDVSALVRLATGGRLSAAQVLARWGLAGLAARRIRSLTQREQRAVDLALALSQAEPLVACLYDPFSSMAGSLDQGAVRQRLRELAAAGCCVVLIGSPRADLARLGDRLLRLDGGRLIADHAAERLAGQGQQQLTVWLDPSAGAGARDLAAALGAGDAVRGVAWEAAGETGSLERVVVLGEPDQTAVLVAEQCVSCGVHVVAVHCSAPAGEHPAPPVLEPPPEPPASPPPEPPASPPPEPPAGAPGPPGGAPEPPLEAAPAGGAAANGTGAAP